MSGETIHNLLHNPEIENKKVGMGIGLNYVKRMLESQYGDKAELRIQSVIGKGTTIFVTIPILEGNRRHD